MATILFANNATTTLAGPLTGTATTLNVAAGTGVLFPQPGTGQYFCLTLTDAATGLLNEILHVTAVNGDTLTIQRGQENTAPQSWLAGDLADNLITAGSLTSFAQSAAITSGAYQGLDTGTSPNAVIVTSTTPALSAPVQGQYFQIVKSGSSNTGGVTMRVGSGGTSTAVLYKDGTGLNAADWPANAAAILYYTGGVFQFVACQGPTQTVPDVAQWHTGTAGGTSAALTTVLTPAPVSGVSVFLGLAMPTNLSNGASATLTFSTLSGTSITAPLVLNSSGAPVTGGELAEGSEAILFYDGTSVRVYASSGTTGATSVSSYVAFRVITASGPVQLDPACKAIEVRCWGGGGGGASSSGVNGGGGGGGYCEGGYAVPANGVLNVVIGSGGAAGANSGGDGATGGSTSVTINGGATLVTSQGGGGGTMGNVGGSGGTGSGGQVVLPGRAGTPAHTPPGLFFPGAGGGAFGTGDTTSNGDVYAGYMPGVGGMGGNSAKGGNGGIGAAGGQGLVIIKQVIGG